MTTSNSKESKIIAAAQELMRRRDARESLIGFTKFTNEQYKEGPHHLLICDALERVLDGSLKRLIICMPPRHGKSELASRRFPAYYLAKNPSKHVIAASYNSELANDFGREVRNIVASDEYNKLFPAIKLAVDSKAANRWHTQNGGMYVAAGVGTAITGRGASLLLIDDPFKDRMEADSGLQRGRVWDWYTSTAYTRLMPNGAIVLINTRWHDDDLTGRLLQEQGNGGDSWEILSLPAINEDGEALWDDSFPLSRLQEIKNVLPPRDWNSLYQQNPVPDEGDYFKTEWFGEYDTPPASLNIYCSSDFAVTEGGGDFTEFGVFGIDQNDNIYVLDWWYGQTASDVWIDKMCDMINMYKPQIWFAESGVIRRSVEPFMMKRMQERNAYCYIEWIASTSKKDVRARSIQARASMGKVYFPKIAKWKEHVMNQLKRFPAGWPDDAVDVMSLMGLGIGYTKSVTKPRIRPFVNYANNWLG